MSIHSKNRGHARSLLNMTCRELNSVLHKKRHDRKLGIRDGKSLINGYARDRSTDGVCAAWVVRA